MGNISQHPSLDKEKKKGVGVVIKWVIFASPSELVFTFTEYTIRATPSKAFLCLPLLPENSESETVEADHFTGCKRGGSISLPHPL